MIRSDKFRDYMLQKKKSVQKIIFIKAKRNSHIIIIVKYAVIKF